MQPVACCALDVMQFALFILLAMASAALSHLWLGCAGCGHHTRARPPRCWQMSPNVPGNHSLLHHARYLPRLLARCNVHFTFYCLETTASSYPASASTCPHNFLIAAQVPSPGLRRASPALAPRLSASPTRRTLCVRVMATAGGGQRLVLWFRNDLRLHDNYIVHEAAQRVKRGEASEVCVCVSFQSVPGGLAGAWALDFRHVAANVAAV